MAESNNQGMTSENQGTWDSTTQTFHGGQDWKFLTNFVDDFSVTTNALGTPVKALEAAKAAVGSIHHYPPSDMEPHMSHLAEFLWPEKGSEFKELLLMGNGASELIDLVIRGAQKGSWRPGDTQTQYKEYARSAEADDRATTTPDDDSASLLCMINPCNPTGDYRCAADMRAYIEQHAKDGSTVIVDESMQPWLGPHWRSDSLIHARDWAAGLAKDRGVEVWIMTSWTKIWSCTGIRLGSVVAPTVEAQRRVKRKQVPWSVNNMALAFLSEVIKDEEYLTRTWELTPAWRNDLVQKLKETVPAWEVINPQNSYLSWAWVDTKDAELAARCVVAAKAAGTPIRSGAPGYNLPTFVRLAVRSPESTEILMRALASAANPSA